MNSIAGCGVVIISERAKLASLIPRHDQLPSFGLNDLIQRNSGTHAQDTTTKTIIYTSRSNTEMNGPIGGERNEPVQQGSGEDQDRGDRRLITDDKKKASLNQTTVSLCQSARLDVCAHLTQRPRNRFHDHKHDGDPRGECASNNRFQLRPGQIRRDPCKT